MVMLKEKILLKNKKISVIGAGSWGTSIASLLANKGYKVYLWGHLQSHIDSLKNDKENKEFLPGYKLHDNIIPTSALEECAENCTVICMVVPSQVYRHVFKDLLQFIEPETAVVTAAKGVENESLKTMSQVMEECITELEIEKKIHLSVLSGPSFAKEVAEKIPTAITIGCKDIAVSKDLQKVFGTDYFRVYASEDVIGLEISGALKNIVAIAAGICDGLQYGLNTRAALITRGLVEIKRFGCHFGADPKTFSGLSGLGDLLLTCTGDLSRNRTVGLKLGEGKKLKDILAEMNMVAEGVKTAKSAFDIVQEIDIEMPILEQVYKILYEDKDCREAVNDLLKRDLKTE